MIKELLEKLIGGENLTEAEAGDAMQELIDGADPHQAAALLVLLRAKGETPEELSGLAGTMRRHAVTVEFEGDLLDTCGTGGDGAHTVNISTGAAVLAAACGAKVAKHGNRSVSSKCGSADVLEALGIAVDLSPEGVARCIREAGIGFMFAPLYHPAMKNVVPIRKGLGIRTAFNLLGPLLNPAGAARQVIGVFDPSLMPLMAQTLRKLSTEHALVVHGCGLDEMTPVGIAQALDVTPEGVREVIFDPKEYGFERCSVEDLQGGTAEENAELLRRSLGGERGAIADSLALNAGAALYVYGTAESVGDGVAQARETLRSGEALSVLERWAAVSTAEKQEESR